MVEIGDTLNGKEVFEAIELSNGWELAKTENGKSSGDFRVKLVNPDHPRGVTIKHAHFAIDFFGKLSYDEELGLQVLEALDRVWHSEPVSEVLSDNQTELSELPGYNLDYFLYALNWILDQEDVNFESRNDDKQEELDRILSEMDIETPEGRKGSELAMSLFCDVARGTHPVEAFYRVNLPI